MLTQKEFESISKTDEFKLKRDLIYQIVGKIECNIDKGYDKLMNMQEKYNMTSKDVHIIETSLSENFWCAMELVAACPFFEITFNKKLFSIIMED